VPVVSSERTISTTGLTLPEAKKGDVMRGAIPPTPQVVLKWYLMLNFYNHRYNCKQVISAAWNWKLDCQSSSNLPPLSTRTLHNTAVGYTWCQRTYVDFFTAVNSAVDFSVVEHSENEDAGNVCVGTLCPASHVTVDDSFVYRHSQRLDTHYLT